MICVSCANIEYHECLDIAENNELIELRLDALDLSTGQIKHLLSYPAKFIAAFRTFEEKLFRTNYDQML